MQQRQTTTATGARTYLCPVDDSTLVILLQGARPGCCDCPMGRGPTMPSPHGGRTT